MKKCLLCLFCAINILFSTAHAQEENKEEEDELFELTLEELLNMEVSSASKFSQKISEAPNIISAINREQIMKYGWLSANDILYSQPGFSPGKDYDRNTVAFRGMFEGWNNNHLLMLVDGVPFNDNLYGTAFTSEITPLIFTKSMEIIRGPGGSLYGSNAMNGVVTYNTLDAKDIKGNGQARLRVGTNNTRVFDVLVGNENDNFGIVTAFNLYSTEGNSYDSYDASGRVDGNGDLLKFKSNDQRENSYFFAKFYGKKKLNGLSLQFHEQRWQFETGHGWLFNIPDEPENMNEFRRIISIKYSPRNNDKNFNYEITTRYQKHGIDWDMRYFPNNPGGDPANYEYPNGLTEYLKTDADDVFLRLQGDYKMGESKILAGIEGTRFYYNGDDAHTSNAYLNGDFTATVPNQFLNMGPWFGFVKNKPVLNVAVFGQYISPKFADKIQLTVSGRYDKQSFNYNEGGIEGGSELDKSFSLFTPRVSLVGNVTDNITLKAIYGKAFRTPSPTEMFGTNTYSLGSNIDELQSEVLTNIDLSIDWRLNENINLRVNGYNVKFEHQIAYGGDFNISVNRNSPTTMGAEIESNFSFNHFSGFINYSLAKRTDEVIEDNTLSQHADEVVWAPSSTFKMGLNYNADKFYISLMAQQQGESLRRDSDKFVGMTAYRSENVEGWVNLDTKLNYKLNENIDLGLIVNNIADSEQNIIRNAANPFDYKRSGRSFMLDLIVKF